MNVPDDTLSSCALNVLPMTLVGSGSVVVTTLAKDNVVCPSAMTDFLAGTDTGTGTGAGAGVGAGTDVMTGVDL